MTRKQLPPTTRIALLFVSLVCFSAAALFAQNPYGRITGRVVDASGAVVPNAVVRVENTGTNVQTDVDSDSQGNYDARNLIPGQYRVTVQRPGFKGYQRGPIEVRVGDVLTINIGLELGAATESVTVTAETPLLEAASANIGQVIDRRRLIDLSMPASNVSYLIQLAPGIISTAAPTQGWQLNGTSTQANFSTNGSGVQTSQFTVDGIPNMLSYGEVDNHAPFPEVLQEFRVQTAPFDASAGHFVGSQVDMVIKSGTNEFHGSGNYQYNGRVLNAIPFFTGRQIYDPTTGPVTQEKINSIVPSVVMNRYRVMVTGPIYIPKLYNGHNRTFFTYGYDHLYRSIGTVTPQTVPTAAERRGDFSALLALGSQYQIYDPATIAPVGNGTFRRLPLPSNVIPATRLDPIAQKLISYYPLPNVVGTPDGLNNFSSSPASLLKRPQHTARLDHVFNPNNRLFVSVMRSYEYTSSSGFPSLLLGAAVDHRSLAMTVDDVAVLRPNLVLDVRYGVHRHAENGLPGSLGFDLKGLGLPASLANQLDPKYTTLPTLTIEPNDAQFPVIGGNGGNSTQSVYQTTYHYLLGSIAQNLGNHSLRFGGEFRAYEQNTTDFFGGGPGSAPSYTFSTDWAQGPLNNSPEAPVGQGLASFLLGLPTDGLITRIASISESSKYAALFVQDDWKVSRKLTVNLGMRYELEVPTTERYNRANRGFDFNTTNPIQAAAQANYARNPIPEIPANAFQLNGGLLFAGVNGVPRGMWNTGAHTFMPRIGLAYQLQDKTVVRAGYGIFFESLGADRYDVLQQGFNQDTSLVPSLDNGQSFQATIANPFPHGLLTAPGASLGLQTFLGQSVSFFSPDRRSGYMQRWTLDIQHEFPRRVLVEVGYIGNRGTGLALNQNLNTIPAKYLSQSPVRDQAAINSLTQQVPNPFFGLTQFSADQPANVARWQLLLPYPEFSNVTTTYSGGFSWYHALEVRAEKRISQGLTLQGNFAWSKFMEATKKLNPTDAEPSHFISSLDRPFNFTGSGVYEVPLGKGRRFLSGAHGPLNQTLGGWSIQAIYQKRSGAPLTFGNIIFNGDIHSIGLSSSQRSLSQWFNTSAGFNRSSNQQLVYNIRTFPLALSGLRTDGVNNWDMGLFKGFQMSERVSLQLRLEGSDMLNHPQFSAPNTNPTSSLFGKVTSTVASQQRVITVGGKLTW
jgi:Carboxypeptidase regulatory-like domain/TonB dependent receptor